MSMTPPPTDSRLSTAAIVTYVLLAIFAATVAGVFALIGFHVKVEPVMLTVLGTVIAAVIGGATVAWGFWLTATMASQKKTDALTQLAGAGPPPPATPLAASAETPPDLAP